MIAAQIWLFIAPGLYRYERPPSCRFFQPAPVLFFTGAAFVYYVMLPYAIRFFVGYETPALPARSASNCRPRSATISIS